VITESHRRYHAAVHISEAIVAAAVTLGISGVSYAAFTSDTLVRRTEAVADAADCRAVDTAIVGYLADHGAAPTSLDQVKPYVRGDVSAYRIRDGRAAGPGCPA
jgi:hypothetical protein